METGITPQSTCDAMNLAYEQLKRLTVEELKECIDRAPYEFSTAFSQGIFEEYRDAYAAECLFVHQCRETIRHKQLKHPGW